MTCVCQFKVRNLIFASSNLLMRLQNRDLLLQPITWQFIAMQAKRKAGIKQKHWQESQLMSKRHTFLDICAIYIYMCHICAILINATGVESFGLSFSYINRKVRFWVPSNTHTVSQHNSQNCC